MQEEGIQSPHEPHAGEMDVSVSDVSMEDWLGEHDHRPIKRAEILRGEIVKISDDGIMVDIGAKSEGIVPPGDLRRLDEDVVESLNEGDSIYVYCLTPEDRQGNILLSISQARIAQDWDRAEQMFGDGELFESKVGGHNKGGLIVYFGRVRGFVPASQLERRRRDRQDSENVDAAQPWSGLVGEDLWLKIIECHRDKNRLILSEQAAVRERRKSLRDELLADLKEGAILSGEVTSIADFGAFVDLGGSDGLIHISELSWNRVNHPSEILSIGEEVQVQIIKLDEDRRRIGLSMKRLEPEPWEIIDDICQVGDVVDGTITKLTNFGAFARINGGIEGLIHISELTDHIIQHPNEVVQSGNEMKLRVIRIEPDRRRIGLSLRQVEDDVWHGRGESQESVPEVEAVDDDQPEKAADVVPDEPADAEIESSTTDDQSDEGEVDAFVSDLPDQPARYETASEAE